MKRKKLCSAILALIMAVSLFSPVMAAEATPLISPAPSDAIVILHTNDAHCGIEEGITYAGVAAYKDKMAEQYKKENVVLVDAGDAIQGGPIGTLSSGTSIVDIMNYIGYDFAVPGNHEFDYGMDTFLSLAKENAKYTYLSCNFTDTAGKEILKGYTVKTFGSTKIAFVGISTPESFSKSNPTFFKDAKGNYIYSFSEGNNGADLYNKVQKTVDAARADGANYVVAISHLGVDESSAPWRSTDLIANTKGIDVIIDGHSHSTVAGSVYKNKEGKDVLLNQGGTKLAALGKVVISPSSGKITAELVTGYEERSESAKAFISQTTAKFNEKLNSVVATNTVNLTTLDPATQKRSIRSKETNLGDLCADAYRAVLGADIAVVNGGGIRADIPKGDITYNDIIKVHPYGNEACMIEATGQQIVDALEHSARNVPQENGGFLQVSGMTYTIDTSVPSSVMLTEKKEFISVSGARRVKDVKVGGVDIDLNKTYTFASHNYMLKSGGDGYTMFKNNKILLDSVMLDNKVLIDYIVKNLKGVVGSEYSDPYGQGRITILADTAVVKPEEKPKTEEKPVIYIYTVAKGDSLWRIASKQLGKGTRWTEIYQLNKDIIKNPSRIYPGQQIKIPA